ncbi:hypothetical protein MKY96_32665 [Paenibacillus sp. FSL R7-0302]|uniref:CCA tRNA nucleotidyltransferase n=1 Tax=Paenibacillus sp. FSL R7-0302 TaxID=2921681 RepID=UPI0030F83E20
MIQIPWDVEVILYMLQTDDPFAEAFVVGGCVRDSIIGKTPKDWDIATNLKPDVVMSLFNSLSFTVVPTGLKHGTVTLIYNGEHYEITTFRTDGAYTDGRRPDEVQFASNIEEDLSRRDFTMNAMAYNKQRGLIDPFNGFNDIQKKVIRAVGKPGERFNEDALRMLRAIRFAAELDFLIDFDTCMAISDNNDKISYISAERKREELMKILSSRAAELGVFLLAQTGMIKHLFPNIGAYNMRELRLIKPAITKLAYLFTYVLDYRGGLNSLKFDNYTIRFVCKVIECLREVESMTSVVSKPQAKKMVIKYGGEEVSQAMLIAIVKDVKFVATNNVFQEVSESREPIHMSELALNGSDLVALGMQGKEIGETLKRLLDLVHHDPGLNDYGKLIRRV